MAQTKIMNDNNFKYKKFILLFVLLMSEIDRWCRFKD